MPKINQKFVKVSNSTGRTASVKKDGYASGSPSDAVRASKPGLNEFTPYSGPQVAKPNRE